MIGPMKETCARCGRKAQRLCPDLRSPLCSQCCGRGRSRTIACPDQCPHYVAGVRTALRRLAELLHEPETEIEFADVLHNLRWALVQLRRTRLPDLTDTEAEQALADAADTMRTRASGLVYDFRSLDPHVQIPASALTDVATLHEKGERGLSRQTPGDLRRCLLYLSRQARQSRERCSGPTAWVELAAQSVGSRLAGAADQRPVTG
jgi:hypothetical protein